MPKKLKLLFKPSPSPSILLFLGSFLVTLFFALITQPFEPPDENAHFSSLQFLANEGRMPTLKDTDNLTLEELQVEEIFGVVEGQNKYSYHPEYRLEYLSGLIGKYEADIELLNTPALRHSYSTFQAATYPPLYYLLTLPVYRVVEPQTFLPRLFLSRLPGVFMTSLTVVVTYYLGLALFSTPAMAATLATLYLFFPMTTYLGAGINSDNLHNLLFTLATYFLVQILRCGYERKYLLAFGTILGLDLLTKPQAYILLPLYLLVVIIRFRYREWRTILISFVYVLLPALLLAGWQELPKFVLGSSALGATAYVATSSVFSGSAHFSTFLRGYLHTHLAEMPVWYWGVFKWFGVLLPKPAWWLGVRLLFLAGLGWLFALYRAYRNRTLSQLLPPVLFLVGGNLIYLSAIFWFDWQFYQQFGRSLGIQPRYYFPLLSTQLALILWGICSLGWNNLTQRYCRTGILIFFFCLHLVGLYTQLNAYYDLSSFNVFISQLSQYKPAFAKGSGWYLWFSLYFLGIMSSLIFILKQTHEVKNRNHHPRL